MAVTSDMERVLVIGQDAQRAKMEPLSVEPCWRVCPEDPSPGLECDDASWAFLPSGG